MAAIEQQPEILDRNSPDSSAWQAFEPDSDAGYVSYYLSDDLAALPVRAITRVKDNKSDPNIETGTYGLFSTCQQKMRSGIVASSPRYLFFVTRPRNSVRHLVGLYELGAWTPGSLSNRIRDFALAAKRVRFIAPVALDSLPKPLAKELAGAWRLDKKLPAEQAKTLSSYVFGQPDLTSSYLAEVSRMENINRFHSGYSYPTWLRHDSWSWADAPRYLKTVPHDPNAPKIRNSSPTGWWGCLNCDAAVENKALLKACPSCSHLDTLRPLSPVEVANVVRGAA
jgi:hypothetical protein